MSDWADERRRSPSTRRRSRARNMAMSDWADERRRGRFEPPDACQTPPAVDKTPDQAANRQKSPPLQAPRRADAGLAVQEQPDVAGGRLDQHPLAHVLMTAHPHAAHTPGLVQVRERPLHQFAPAALQATTPPPPHTPPVPIQRPLRCTRRVADRTAAVFSGRTSNTESFAVHGCAPGNGTITAGLRLIADGVEEDPPIAVAPTVSVTVTSQEAPGRRDGDPNTTEHDAFGSAAQSGVE